MTLETRMLWRKSANLVFPPSMQIFFIVQQTQSHICLSLRSYSSGLFGPQVLHLLVKGNLVNFHDHKPCKNRELLILQDHRHSHNDLLKHCPRMLQLPLCHHYTCPPPKAGIAFQECQYVLWTDRHVILKGQIDLKSHPFVCSVVQPFIFVSLL